MSPWYVKHSLKTLKSGSETGWRRIFLPKPNPSSSQTTNPNPTYNYNRPFQESYYKLFPAKVANYRSRTSARRNNMIISLYLYCSADPQTSKKITLYYSINKSTHNAVQKSTPVWQVPYWVLICTNCKTFNRLVTHLLQWSWNYWDGPW